MCIICKLSKINSDFINDKDECYKCEYARKVKDVEESKKKKVCRLCGKDIPELRWTYCSKPCAVEAKKRHRHWTNKFRTDTKDWKKRFMGMSSRQKEMGN